MVETTFESSQTPKFEARRRRARVLASRRGGRTHDAPELPGRSRLVEAHLPLERLRARKTPRRAGFACAWASQNWVGRTSMLAVVAESHGPGATKAELVEALRREEVNRGLTFEYCLITAGTSLNRAPSEQRLRRRRYQFRSTSGRQRTKAHIGDLCRMAVLGAQPDAELESTCSARSTRCQHGGAQADPTAAHDGGGCTLAPLRSAGARRVCPAANSTRVRRAWDGPHQP